MTSKNTDSGLRLANTKMPMKTFGFDNKLKSLLSSPSNDVNVEFKKYVKEVEFIEDPFFPNNKESSINGDDSVSSPVKHKVTLCLFQARLLRRRKLDWCVDTAIQSIRVCSGS